MSKLIKDEFKSEIDKKRKVVIAQRRIVEEKSYTDYILAIDEIKKRIEAKEAQIKDLKDTLIKDKWLLHELSKIEKEVMSERKKEVDKEIKQAKNK